MHVGPTVPTYISTFTTKQKVWASNQLFKLNNGIDNVPHHHTQFILTLRVRTKIKGFLWGREAQHKRGNIVYSHRMQSWQPLVFNFK